MHLDSISHRPQGLRSGLLCSGPQTKVLGYNILHCEILSALCHFLYLNSHIVSSHPALEHSQLVCPIHPQPMEVQLKLYYSKFLFLFFRPQQERLICYSDTSYGLGYRVNYIRVLAGQYVLLLRVHNVCGS
jgi:hypothetical protein